MNLANLRLLAILDEARGAETAGNRARANTNNRRNRNANNEDDDAPANDENQEQEDTDAPGNENDTERQQETDDNNEQEQQREDQDEQQQEEETNDRENAADDGNPGEQGEENDENPDEGEAPEGGEDAGGEDDFSLDADDPTEEGGEDEGPAPDGLPEADDDGSNDNPEESEETNLQTNILNMSKLDRTIAKKTCYQYFMDLRATVVSAQNIIDRNAATIDPDVREIATEKLSSLLNRINEYLMYKFQLANYEDALQTYFLFVKEVNAQTEYVRTEGINGAKKK